MKELLAQIRAWLAAGERVATATVVRVTGSAPRGVGATMAVSSGGAMAGSVSGGCVETTVYAEMMDVLKGGPVRTLHFGITEEMIWEVGLACGGSIDVLLQPLEPGLFARWAELVERRVPCALATPASGERAGASALVTAEGVLAGPDEGAIRAAAQGVLASRAESGVLQHLPEGVELFIQPFQVAPALLIVGGVHIAIPLVRFAKELGFYVIVVDPRAKFANRERFPGADEILVEWPDEALRKVTVDETSSVVLLTHDPKIDEPTLAAALQTPARYIGAVGSRKTHADRFERMAKWGVSAEQLERVYSPIGLDLGGRTAEETALSIIAEVVAVKHARTGGFLRQGRPAAAR